jgi:radical SAM protein with 4Fe4S-binding SPASM domain
MSIFGPSSDLDSTGAQHNVSRIEEIGRASSAFFRRFPDGTPFFTFVEFSITDLCNRTCIFCPRHDPEVYPNSNSEMSLQLYKKIMCELAELQWQGLVSFSGFGEPMLHTKLVELIKKTKSHLPDCELEIVTNGDQLTLENVAAIFAAGVDCLKISLYDGPQQIAGFERLRDELGLDEEKFIIRYRFLSPEDGFGLILSNRAGTVSFDELPLIPLDKGLERQCFFPFYKMMVDWDGRVLLCSHDWIKKLSGGDLNEQSLAEVWTGETMQRVRKSLAQGDRCFKPCSACDVNGTLNGGDAYEKWAGVFTPEEGSGSRQGD